MPLAEAQSEWVDDLLQGRAGLPDRAAMHVHIDRTARQVARRYASSPRHTIQVDFYSHKRSLQRERRRGRQRPAAQAVEGGGATA